MGGTLRTHANTPAKIRRARLRQDATASRDRDPLVEREALHLAVEAHVRHVPVATTIELLDPVRRDLRHCLVVEDEPCRLVLLDPCHVVPPLGCAALVRDDGEELVPPRFVVAPCPLDDAHVHRRRLPRLLRLHLCGLRARGGGGGGLRAVGRWYHANLRLERRAIGADARLELGGAQIADVEHLGESDAAQDLGFLVGVRAEIEAYKLHGKVRRQPRDLPLHLVLRVAAQRGRVLFDALLKGRLNGTVQVRRLVVDVAL
mmetsp:Transcript_18259/g.37198  ORF Transcript_18259/g.37198 Transcript_18259/m.37198 type:complete len:260 (+) Transcript_18259:84-863(+)